MINADFNFLVNFNFFYISFFFNLYLFLKGKRASVIFPFFPVFFLF